MKFVLLSFVLIPALVGLGRGAPGAVPRSSCCLCVGYLNPDGEIVLGCDCTMSYGGLSCSINASGCRTPGTCTSGGGL